MRFNPFSDVTAKEEIQEMLFNRIIDSRTRSPDFGILETAMMSIAAKYMTLLLLSADPTLDFVQKKRIYEIMLFEQISEGFSSQVLSGTRKTSNHSSPSATIALLKSSPSFRRISRLLLRLM